MIKIFKLCRSMRCNYRPLEFLIWLRTTFCCLWSSTFIKNPNVIKPLDWHSWRLSHNAISVCLLTFVLKDTGKASSRTNFMIEPNSFPCCSHYLYLIIFCNSSNVNDSFAFDLFLNGCMQLFKKWLLWCFMFLLHLAVFLQSVGRTVSCGSAHLLKCIHLWESKQYCQKM